MSQWFNDTVSQGHGVNGETGIDIATPNDTPISAIFGGKVVKADWQPYGGEVFLAVPGSNVLEGFIHLDNINVALGDTIKPGQNIGTSGGGVGDNLVKNGRVQPATSQADWGNYSSGYHTEYDLFQGQTSADVDKAWFNPAVQLDPTTVINSLNQNGSAKLPGGGGLSTGLNGGTPPPSSTSGGFNINNLWQQLTGTVLGGVASGATAGLTSGANAPFSSHNMARYGVGTLGAIVVILGVLDMVLSLQDKASETLQPIVEKYGKLAEV